VTLLMSLAVLVAAALIALAVRNEEPMPHGGGGPVPPGGL
jgi:hypothetical protein